MNKIHIISRAVIRKEDAILLTHHKDFFFLPGGHVKHCESTREALKRELKEEIGIDSKVNCFMGALECVWDNEGVPFHEINFVFDVIVEDLSKNKNLLSRESHINFEWFNLKDLEKINFLPNGMIKFIKSWKIEEAPQLHSVS